MLVKLFSKLDGGSFGYALSENGNTCIQLGTHGSLTGVRFVSSSFIPVEVWPQQWQQQ